MKKKHFVETAVFLALVAAFVIPTGQVYAAEDLDAQIRAQQRELEKLQEMKSSQDNAELKRQIDFLFKTLDEMRSQNNSSALEKKITELSKSLESLKNQGSNPAVEKQLASLAENMKEMRSRGNYNAEGAVEGLAAQIDTLRQEISAQDERQNRLMSAIERLEQLVASQASQPQEYAQPGGCINPPASETSYIQNASSSQGKSTMVFRYAPNQIYEIYCRTGYLTDLAFHKGETINFVGGGDTSAWAINSTTVDGVPHLYIKPTVDTSSTNIIVTTDKRSYQLLVNTSDWYTPMVSWTYGSEDLQNMLGEKARNERTVTDTLKGSYDSLNFSYSISGSSSGKPSMVFDDGEKTIIKYSEKMPSKAPAMFVRERGMKGVSLVNFRIKNGCYIIDRVVDEAELRFSDSDIVRIKRKS